MTPIAKLGVAAGSLVVAAVALMAFGPIYTVDQGEEAVVLRNGAIIDTEGAGLHFKLPFVDSVRSVSLQMQTRQYGAGDAKMEAFSRDQQALDVVSSVNFHVPSGSAKAVYAQYGDLNTLAARLIDRKLPAVLKDVFGQYDIQTAVQQRVKLNADILTALQQSVTGSPVEIDSLQIEDMSPTKAYRDAIEAKQEATVEVQKREQQLAQQKVQAEITVTTAQAAADAQLAAAKAQAQATQLAGEAEAAAIRAKGDALRDNPNLIDLTKAERWDGKLPETMVPGTAIPFLDAAAR